MPLKTTYWWVDGGIAGSLWEFLEKRLAARPPAAAGETELPSDMSTTSLIGGGLIAGESLGALTVGITTLVQAMHSMH